jgi:hypothetical protein
MGKLYSEQQKKIDQERKQNRENFDRLSKEIGAYILSFEYVMMHIRIIIEDIYKKQGLSNRKIVEVMLADVQADQLCKRLDGLIAVSFPEEIKDKETKILLKGIYEQLEEIVKFRNKLAHAHWHIEHSVGDDNQYRTRLVATGQRIKRLKGLEDNFPNVDFNYVEELKNKSELNYKLTSKLGELSINIRQKTPLKRKWHTE